MPNAATQGRLAPDAETGCAAHSRRPRHARGFGDSTSPRQAQPSDLQVGHSFTLALLPGGELHPNQGLLFDDQLHSPFLKRMEGVTRERRVSLRVDLPTLGDL